MADLKNLPHAYQSVTAKNFTLPRTNLKKGVNMRLAWLKIENFRSIDSAEIDIHDFTTVIGPNNSGKSTLLHAIDMALSIRNAEPDDWPRGDFSRPITIEMRFDTIEDWEREISGIAGIVYNGEIHIRAQFSMKLDGKVEKQKYSAKTRPFKIDGLEDTWRPTSETIKSIASTLGINSTNFKLKNNQEKIRAHIKDNHPDLVSEGNENFYEDSISISQALAQGLPKPAYIPAVTDATEESKPGGKTAFAVLLEKVLLPAVTNSKEYKDILGALEKLRARLDTSEDNPIQQVKEISDAISSRMKSLVSASAKIVIDEPDFNKPLTSSFGMRLDDGMETPVHRQGHGVQRTLIFALLEELAKQTRKRPADHAHGAQPIVLLFEEPELFIHPQLMRKLREILNEIGKLTGWQVIISTHSPFLISVAENPMSMVIVTRSDGNSAPVFKQLKSNPFQSSDSKPLEREALRASLDFHPTVCEAFFGQHTILVEGDSEVAILKHSRDLLRHCAIDTNTFDMVSVVSCGGKWTIPAIARLLHALNLPVRVIHDEDRKGRCEIQLQECDGKDPYCANNVIKSIVGINNVFMCRDKLEDTLWGKQKTLGRDKPFKCWKEIRRLLKNPAEIANRSDLVALVKFAYGNLEGRKAAS